MSAAGYCSGDNAACKGFFGLFKRERVHGMTYPKLDDARADVFEYIERLHNPRRRRRVARQDQKFSVLTTVRDLGVAPPPPGFYGWCGIGADRYEFLVDPLCSNFPSRGTPPIWAGRGRR